MTLSINSLKDRIFRLHKAYQECDRLLSQLDRIRQEMRQLDQEIYDSLEPETLYFLPEMQGTCVRTLHPDIAEQLITFERVETLLPPT